MDKDQVLGRINHQGGKYSIMTDPISSEERTVCGLEQFLCFERVKIVEMEGVLVFCCDVRWIVWIEVVVPASQVE